MRHLFCRRGHRRIPEITTIRKRNGKTYYNCRLCRRMVKARSRAKSGSSLPRYGPGGNAPVKKADRDRKMHTFTPIPDVEGWEINRLGQTKCRAGQPYDARPGTDEEVCKAFVKGQWVPLFPLLERAFPQRRVKVDEGKTRDHKQYVDRRPVSTILDQALVHFVPVVWGGGRNR